MCLNCILRSPTHRKILASDVGQDNGSVVAATEAAIGLWTGGLPHQVIVRHEAPDSEDVLKQLVQQRSAHTDDQDDGEAKEEADPIQGTVARWAVVVVIGIATLDWLWGCTPSSAAAPTQLLEVTGPLQVPCSKVPLLVDVPIPTGDRMKPLDLREERRDMVFLPVLFTGTVPVVLR